MSWLVLLAFAVIAGGALWRFGNMPRAALELSGAALLLGIAGYAWQGSPGMPGSSITSSEKAAVTLPDPETRRQMMGRFGSEAEWLDYADTANKLGSSNAAVNIMKAGLAKFPNSADMWVGLGNALVVHGGGVMNPAAQFAFEKAARLSPNHPGPPFFLGLALAQSGKVDEAADVWRGLLERAPKDAPWRADLEARLTAIGGMPSPNGPLSTPSKAP
jgi:cytochrome c-type biogenesis protein CcmH